MTNLENKERILKDSRGKYQLTYSVKHIKITSDLAAQPQKPGKRGAV
jgi:hypothetical protein